MSKFQSTISTVAALTTIFGAAVGGWKIAEQQQEYNKQQEVINNLQEQVSNKEQETQSVPLVAPPAIQLPQSSTVQQVPQPVTLPQAVVLPQPTQQQTQTTTQVNSVPVAPPPPPTKTTQDQK